MLYIKMMSGEDSADVYAGKNYTLITVGDKDRIQFGEWGALYHNPVDPWNYDGNTEVMIIIRENSEEQETYRILGNVYIMNEQGKTISTRSPRT
jgi:hypothetical protein